LEVDSHQREIAIMSSSRILLLAALLSALAPSAAFAEGPVGGATTPGDPSLLVTYPWPAPAAVASPPDPIEPTRHGITAPENSRKDG
jgi:hypothetical protein